MDKALASQKAIGQSIPDIRFTAELTDTAEVQWRDDIRQLIFNGSPVRQEVVFFHNPTRALILTDLIENFDPRVFIWWQRPVARITGILRPNGKTPVDWRSSFFFGKLQARQCYAIMEEWQPENIIISHGSCIYGDGTEFLRRSFSWLR